MTKNRKVTLKRGQLRETLDIPDGIDIFLYLRLFCMEWRKIENNWILYGKPKQ